MPLFSSTYQPSRQSRTRALVFVYGTLLSGCGNHAVLQRDPTTRFIGTGSIRAQMFTAHWGYPHIKFSKNNKHRVIGEVYEVSRSLLYSGLDRLEGYSRSRAAKGSCLYFRKKITVTMDRPLIVSESFNTRQFTTFVYEAGDYLKDRSELIQSGDWKQAKAARGSTTSW